METQELQKTKELMEEAADTCEGLMQFVLDVERCRESDSEQVADYAREVEEEVDRLLT
jgi:hypothetical protein